MYKRRTKPLQKSQVLSSSIGRGSDIVAPNNTSLIVNRSQVSNENSSTETINFLKNNNDDDSNRKSSAIMQSMSEKAHSTPEPRHTPRPLCVSNISAVQPRRSTRNSMQLVDPLPEGSIAVETRRRDITSKKTPKKKATSHFLLLLQECGAEEVDGEGSFTLSVDQAMLCLKLNQTLKESGEADKFFSSFKEYIADVENLKKVVMYTQTDSSCDVARGPVQDPILRSLLLVDCLQSKILSLLFDKIGLILVDGKTDEEIQLVIFILRQMRCLNRFENTKFGSKLLELIEIAPIQLQKDIIFHLPELIVEDEVDHSANQLVDLLREDCELTPGIVDCLSPLPLSAALRSDIKNRIVIRLNKSPYPYLPNLTQFVVSHFQPHEALEVVLALRQHLPFTDVPAVDNEKDQSDYDCSVKKTFDNLKFAVMSSKHLTDAWMKAVSNIATFEEVRPIDVVMMALIHGFVLGRKPSVLVLLKNKIRAGILTEGHIRQTFKILKAVISDNYNEVLELSSALLLSSETTIADIGIAFYLETFSNFDSFYRQEVVCQVLVHLTAGTPTTVSNALNLFTRLRDLHSRDLEDFSSSLVSALRKISDLDLCQVRQLMDVLASLITAPSLHDSGVVEEVQIFIRKQISTWQPEAQKKGIVAGLTFVKNVAKSLTASDSESSENSTAAECRFLLKMALGSLSGPHARRGFFYDELATVLRDVDIQTGILSSWLSSFRGRAKDIIFASNYDFGCNEFPISLQYSMENSENLVMPAVAFILKPELASDMHPGIIPAALRLLWCTEKDFSRLSAVMTASVILPDASVYENFLSYDTCQQKYIMDSLFLCANYFIECINALACQKSGEKIMIRLKQLIEVRKLIEEHIGSIPEYVPPVCQYHYPVQFQPPKPPAERRRTGRGRKRKSNGAEVNDAANQSVLPSTSTAAPTEALNELVSNSPTEHTDLNRYSASFRQLHCHTYKLLRMELKLNPTKVFKKKKMSDLIVCDVSWSYRSEDKPELGPSDALYLLQDYLHKSDEILRERPPFLAKKTPCFVVDVKAPSTFVLGTVKMLPKLCLKLDVVNNYCTELLKASDGIRDAPGMFPDGSVPIKLTFNALLRVIADVVAWRAFLNPIHKTILKDTLQILSRRTNTASNVNLDSVAVEAARFVASHREAVPLLSSAVSIVRAVQAILQFSAAKDMALVGELSEEFLQRPWYTVNGAADRGSDYNQKIDSLLRLFLNCSPNRLSVVQKTVEVASNEISGLSGKEEPLNSFKTITKSNFPLLYRALCEALVSAAAEELSRKSGNDDGCIEVWGTVMKTLLCLVEIAKIHTSRTNLAALLKRCQAIIQQFLSKGLPVMESALRVKSEEVLKVLKSLQAVTRFLHSVCCHSKLKSDAVVAAHVPAIRSLCERLTLEVKGMLILNKIPMDFITIAVLKNRDIQGNDILSQTTLASEDDESELPPEEQAMDTTDIESDVVEETSSELF